MERLKYALSGGLGGAMIGAFTALVAIEIASIVRSLGYLETLLIVMAFSTSYAIFICWQGYEQ